jgi:hypothetical protein
MVRPRRRETGETVSAQFSASDSECLETDTVDANGGTITLGAVSTDRVTGSFNLTLYDDGVLSGTFNSPTCDIGDLIGDADGSAPPCQQ